MKKKYLLLSLLFIMSFSSYAVESNPCVVPGSSVEIPVFDFMIYSMGIKKTDVVESKTKLELIDNTPVTKELAVFFATESKFKAHDNLLDLQGYYDIYMMNNPRNLTIKYTYENLNGKHNVFIGSAIVNNDECSIRFNGQIIVKREF